MFILFAPTVTVTCAKALLIIVGDPLVLGLDPLWSAYCNIVHMEGGWRGQPIPWDPENLDGGYDVDLHMCALGTMHSHSLMGLTLMQVKINCYVFGFASHSFTDASTQSGGGGHLIACNSVFIDYNCL